MEQTQKRQSSMYILFSKYLGQFCQKSLRRSSKMTFTQLLLKYFPSICWTQAQSLRLLQREQAIHLLKQSIKMCGRAMSPQVALQANTKLVQLIVRADSGPISPPMQISQQRQLNRIDIISFLTTAYDYLLISSSFLPIFIFSLYSSELISGPFSLLCNYSMYSAKDRSCRTDEIQSWFQYLSKRQDSTSNSLAIMSLLREQREESGVSLGLKANSSTTYSSKLLNTFEYCWQNPQLNSLNLSLDYYSPSPAFVYVPPITSMLTLLLFFSFFRFTTLEMRSKLLKNSPGVCFSRCTSRTYFQ